MFNAKRALVIIWGHGYDVMNITVRTLASGAWPDRGRPGPKPGLKAEVSPATSQALAGLAKG